MNVADRSLAIVDFALRRRFAFVDLEPTFGKVWRTWVNEKSGISLEFLELIETRLTKLNKEIEEDVNLGAQFKIGHSYLTIKESVSDEAKWFRQVVHTEIGPLLDEYWFDDRDRAKRCKNELVEGM
jgi:5-methylcytosine-specific restriction protein B